MAQPMPEQLVFLTTFPTAAVSKTYVILAVATLNPLPARAAKGNTPGEIMLERLKVDCDRV